jgi:hypothetical protein
MHYHRISRRRARAIRAKALFLTLLFHLALIGYLAYGSDIEWAAYLPETVQEWVGLSEKALESPERPQP